MMRARTYKPEIILIALMVLLMLALVACRLLVASAVNEAARIHRRADKLMYVYDDVGPRHDVVADGWYISGSGSAYSRYQGGYCIVELRTFSSEPGIQHSVSRVALVVQLSMVPTVRVLRTDDPVAQRIAESLAHDLAVAAAPEVHPNLAAGAPALRASPSRVMQFLVAIAYRYYGLIFLNGACVILVTMAVALARSRRRRAAGLRCWNCGYDLRGNRSGCCPECGRVAEFNFEQLNG